MKCIYSSTDDPCKRCTRKNFSCVKVYGPKRAAASGSGTSSNTSPTIIPEDDEESLPVVASPIPLITDSELPEREISLVQQLHRHHRGSKIGSCVGVLLKNLWNAYGAVFTDKTLLYSALTWESYWKDYGSDGWSPGGTYEYYFYKSRFHESLADAMRTEAITECHFFALFLASQSSKSGVPGFKEELAMYQQGMVHVMKFLNGRPENDKRRFRPLKKLHSFILSFTRRILCRGDFSMPEYLVEDAAKDLPEVEMQQVAKRLPIATSIHNFGATLRSSSVHSHDHGFNLHQWDYWNQVDCCLCTEFELMSDCFHMFVRSGETCRLVEQAIRSTRQKVDNMLNIHDISYVFKCVYLPLQRKLIVRYMTHLSP